MSGLTDEQNQTMYAEVLKLPGRLDLLKASIDEIHKHGSSAGLARGEKLEEKIDLNTNHLSSMEGKGKLFVIIIAILNGLFLTVLVASSVLKMLS